MINPIILSKKKPRLDVQILRGASIVGVVVFHAAPEYFPNGYLGVDAFFVIAGYLVVNRMVNVYQREIGSKLGMMRFTNIYLVQRLKRLSPNIIVVTAISLLLLLLLGDTRDLDRAKAQAIQSVLFVSNLNAEEYVGDYFSPRPSPFLHFWSTAFEMQAFLIIALVAALLWSILPEYLARNLYISTLVVIGIFSFIAFILYLDESYKLVGQTYFRTELRIWEIVLSGAFLTSTAFRVLKTLQIVKNISLAACLLLIVMPHSIPSGLAIVSTVFFASLFLKVERGMMTNPISSLLVKIGDRAYSIFCVHYPILFLAKYSPVFGETQERMVQTLLSLPIILLTSEWLHHKVEIPFSKPRMMRDKKYRLGLASAFLGIPLLIGYQLLSNNVLRYVHPDMESNQNQSKAPVSCELSMRDKPCLLEPEIGEHKPKLLVLGDSHAFVLLDVINRHYRDQFRVASFAAPACSFTWEIGISKDGLNECQLHNKRVTDYIDAEPIDAVVVAFRSSSLLPERFVTSHAYLNKLRSTAVELRNRIDTVILVLPNPEFRPSIVLTLPNRNKLDFLDKAAFTDTSFLQKSLRAEDIFLINSPDLFCNTMSCFNSDSSNRSMLSDLDHLSPFGAEILKANFPTLRKSSIVETKEVKVEK